MVEFKRKIASQIDYIESDHPRSVYLEGMKIFENLKHSFQDDIHLLHNVNAVYHKTSGKDLDVNNYLKNHVLELNDRWRNIYQKVTDILTVINNILQLWADYDQLHEHVHLFLTETHIKITTLEQNNSLTQIEYNSIMDEFKHHKDALERFNSTANNLKQRSKCSAKEINCQVEEIRRYWAEIYEYLQRCRESVSKNNERMKKEQMLQASTVTLEQTAYQVLNDDGNTSSADNF
ncbi:nesprin-1 [Caerostris extrusa]|uniref:Nesprin-1 n=1 Tax=Caerostris extrusa TaxID=172846 RepID=A0AAV4XY44_CAEEX|nr:nesprin-1 [Caerostris extrusa]